jgi:hypothetical protein
VTASGLADVGVTPAVVQREDAAHQGQERNVRSRHRSRCVPGRTLLVRKSLVAGALDMLGGVVRRDVIKVVTAKQRASDGEVAFAIPPRSIPRARKLLHCLQCPQD